MCGKLKPTLESQHNFILSVYLCARVSNLPNLRIRILHFSLFKEHEVVAEIDYLFSSNGLNSIIGFESFIGSTCGFEESVALLGIVFFGF
jgi:hypothetical protein